MAEEKIKELKIKRGQQKGLVTRTRNWLDKLDLESVDAKALVEVKERLSKLAKVFQQYNTIQDALELLEGPSDDNEKERASFEESYFSVISEMKDLLEPKAKANQDANNQVSGPSNNDTNTLPGVEQASAQNNNSGNASAIDNSSTQSTGQSSSQSNIQPVQNVQPLPNMQPQMQMYMNPSTLPAMKPPTFDGSFDKWLEFRDSYIALIHNNPIFTDIQKFQYLRTSLTEKPLQCIKSIAITDANYNIAWQALQERYDKSQVIRENHVKQILDASKVTRESGKDLWELYNTINNNLEALKNLQEPVDHWDGILIPIVIEKLDYQSRKEWERLCINDLNRKTSKDLFTFIKNRCSVLEKLEVNKTHNVKNDKPVAKNEKGKIQVGAHYSVTRGKCYFCKNDHSIYKCDSFLKLTPVQRLSEAKKLQLCINCLRPAHTGDQKCPVSNCKHCNRFHNSLVHIDNYRGANRGQGQVETQSNNKNQVNSSNSSNSTNSNQVPETGDKDPGTTVSTHAIEECSLANMVGFSGQKVLSTAVVSVEDKSGYLHPCRTLLDQGAMSNFIRQDFCEKMGIKLIKANISVSGVGGAIQMIKHVAYVTIISNYCEFRETIPCLVLPKVTVDLPLSTFNKNEFDIPDYLQLADPQFNECRQVDLLLCVSLFYKILGNRSKFIKGTDLCLRETKLGWIVGGALDSFDSMQFVKSVNCLSIVPNLEAQLVKFWELEEVNVTKPVYSREEQKVEDHFLKTYKRADDGHFIVSIPFTSDVNKLGDSRESALKRFYSLEKKLKSNDKLCKDYCNFMNEYLSMSHMEIMNESIKESRESGYYIPHHPVIREESKTTKVRVVFDASAPTDNGKGPSLNKVQFPGPAIQNDIVDILLNFRLPNIVLTGDICKMYRMVWVEPSQRKFQKILWRANSSEEVQCYQLKTVTYGTASAPYLAMRCLNQLAYDNQEKYPEAAKIIKNYFYVDDLLWGCNDESELISRQHEVSKILDEAGFQLRKYLCNKPELVKKFKVEGDLDYNILPIGENQLNKTLGVSWNAEKDTIQYNSALKEEKVSNTKRSILSEIAQLYDPLGLVGPVTILGKIFMQKIWSMKYSWDEEIPEDLLGDWIEFREQLKEINKIRIPRQVTIFNFCKLEIHGFSDSSERAYGAAIYIRSQDEDGNFHSELLCAKSKVAPLKKVTLPRLELCGAQLLTRLFKKVKQAIETPVENYYLYTDSTIVLSWINICPSKMQTFVGNRISEIQGNSDPKNWYHISSSENPADIISRGSTINGLNTLWWHGPQWLQDPILPESIMQKSTTLTEELPEMRIVAGVAIYKYDSEFNIFKRYSDFKKLLAVVANCFKFIKLCKERVKMRKEGNPLPKAIIPKEKRQYDALNVDELDVALKALVRRAQVESFKREFALLQKKSPVESYSPLRSLSPFLDKDDVMRVGGRIENSECSYDKKHPMILPHKHELTELILSSIHEDLLHCGAKMLLSNIRERFWPIKGRSLVKQFTRKCTICFLGKPKNLEYVMGNLPAARVTKSFPFEHVGVDYAGPITIMDKKTRGAKPIKAYICLFVCFATKAIHLELVTELTTIGFNACLRRFISRRGKPSQIYSDNAKNFVGASKELRELYEFLCKEKSNVKQFLAQQGIKWSFIPARSPTFGGLWEAGVKSVKYHLKRVLENSKVTYEDLSTILYQIEAILNSRPLCKLLDDPESLDPLTPGHFLIGRGLVSLPDKENYLEIPSNRLKHFEQLQKTIQEFWKTWSQDYLSDLQQRVKWKVPVDKDQECLKIGRVVLLKEDNVPSKSWRLGRIVELHPGKDEVIRVVSVKTNEGVFKRSIQKVCPLPIN